MPATQELTDYKKERGKPLPSISHGLLQTAILLSLADYRRDYSFPSELTLELEGLSRNVTPDICIYPKLNADFSNDEVRMTEPPLVAVEIASPTHFTQDIVDKIQDLLATGAKSCWLVQPAMQTITVYTEDAGPETWSEGKLSDPVADIEVDVTKVKVPESVCVR